MKIMILAAFAALSLGVANAAVANNGHTPIQQGNSYNFPEGGG